MANLVNVSTCLCKKCLRKIISTEFPLFTYTHDLEEYFEFVKNVKTYECPYCHTTGKVIPIDSEIIDSIILFHKKGWKTKSCCGGCITSYHFIPFTVIFYLPSKWNSVDWFIRMVSPEDHLICQLLYEREIPSLGNYILKDSNLLCKITVDPLLIPSLTEITPEEEQKILSILTKARKGFQRMVLELPNLTTKIPIFTKDGDINPDAL